MSRNRLTVDELLEELRGKGYTDLSQIKLLVQPGAVVAQGLQVVLQQMPVADHHPGQPPLLHADLQVGPPLHGMGGFGMKRLYIAAALLALLLGASLANAWYVQGMADGMRDRLEQAQALTRQGDWERAEALTRQTYQDHADLQVPGGGGLLVGVGQH